MGLPMIKKNHSLCILPSTLCAYILYNYKIYSSIYLSWYLYCIIFFGSKHLFRNRKNKYTFKNI